MEFIGQLFGESFLNIDRRIESYGFIEKFISEQHEDWLVPPNTAVIVKAFIDRISTMTDKEFSFLLIHSGYIPETYEADSSQETLYSKLTEVLVLEWAKRMGFKDSVLPTQKSSMEDVSILDESYVIVCDSKSFRLGRSQSAPNVKDVLKQADIKRWLSAHKSHKHLGGLIAFPSQHEWKRGSDYYQYLTDNSSPILSLYYEQLAYLLLFKVDKNRLIKAYNNHGEIFPEKTVCKLSNRKVYHEGLIKNLFTSDGENWPEFNVAAQKIISENVYNTLNELEKHCDAIKQTIINNYKDETNLNILRSKLIEVETAISTSQIQKQIDRIGKFRNAAEGYHEED